MTALCLPCERRVPLHDWIKHHCGRRLHVHIEMEYSDEKRSLQDQV